MKHLRFIPVFSAAALACASMLTAGARPESRHLATSSQKTVFEDAVVRMGGHRHSINYLFDDEFRGPAGSPPNSREWWATPWCSTSPNDAEGCYKSSNVYLDGRGHLALKVSPGTLGRTFDFARVQTFIERGWPPSTVLAKFAPPFRLQARIKFAPGAGLWQGFWTSSNSTRAASLELDLQEFRGLYPSQVSVHTHIRNVYANATDVGFDGSASFHTYWCDYYADHVVFGVDAFETGRTSLHSAPPQMIRLSNQIGVPGTWGGEGGPPPSNLLPGIMLVDYVRAWRIANRR